MTPKLSTIICTFNRAPSLQKCLESLTKQSSLNSLAFGEKSPASLDIFEVVIVDAGSTDNTGQIISRYSESLKIKTIVFEEKELAKARDLGWRNSQAELVAWIDDDVIVSPGWLKEIIDIFEKNPEIGGVSGPTIVPEELLKNRDIFLFYGKKGMKGLLGKIWNEFFLEGKMFEVGRIFKSGAWSPGSNFSPSLEIKGLKEVDYLEACNMALRRNLVEKVGGFDLNYKGVAEWSEIDLAMRVKKLGYRLVFSSKARADHYPSMAGVFERRTRAKQRMENFLKFYFNHVFKLKPNYLFKFSIYLFFLNIYWIYKTMATKNVDWLGGCLGTLTGFKYLFSKQNPPVKSCHGKI